MSIRDVSFSYRRGGGRWAGGSASGAVVPGGLALDRISLDIEPEVIVGVIGPNGGGKTTLLRLILGELRPDRGQITVAGMRPAEAVARGDIIGYLPQLAGGTGPGGFEVTRLPLTVREAVRLGLAGKTGLLRPYAADDLAFVEHIMERVGLSGVAEEPIQSLSGGQLQRVYVARALAPRPRLLLLDEPTTGIDRGNQQRLIELVAELRKELKLAVVLVSHDLRAVTSVSDRIACLNVTLHYHDVPRSFPAELARGMFCCDLEAMGLGHGSGCAHAEHGPGRSAAAGEGAAERVVGGVAGGVGVAARERGR